MKILLKGPVKGTRKPLCRTDEAMISRITANSRYNGMVERLQIVGSTETILPFHLYLSGGRQYVTSAESVDYHLLKFLSVHLARVLFPRNFIDLQEIRFFRRDGKVLAATCSDFIPDASEVIERRMRYMRRFYEATDAWEKTGIRELADNMERTLCPDFVFFSSRIKVAGVIMDHPEANYHLFDGKPVFFEVDGLNLRTAYLTVMEGVITNNIEEAVKVLAIICATFLKGWAYGAVHSSDFERKHAQMIIDTDFRTLAATLRIIFLEYPLVALDIIKNHFDMVTEVLSDSFIKRVKNSDFRGIPNLDPIFLELRKI